MSSSPRSPQAPPPRRHWLVALTAGLFRGLGSLLTTIANWLEANPTDPRPSAGVLGATIVLVVAAALAIGRTPAPATEVATRPAIEAPAETTPDAAIDTAPTADPEPTGETIEDAPPLDLPNFETVPSEEPISVEPILNPDETTLEPTFEAEPAVGDPEETETSEIPEIPEELTAPDAARTLEPAPPPLTPEQRLIAALQARIAAVSEEFADDDLVVAVQVDFDRNFLNVEVSDRWYDLPDTEQDRVAAELRDRGVQFDFYDLNIVDADGVLVARPALVGDGTIVLRRLRD